MNRIRSIVACTLVWMLCHCGVTVVLGMKQHWDFNHEDRREFFIEHFGFGQDAHMKVRVSDVQLAIQPPKEIKDAKPVTLTIEQAKDKVIASLLFIHESQLWDVVTYMQETSSDQECLVQNRSSEAWIDFAEPSTWNVTKTVGSAELPPGFYYIAFAQCTRGLEISFKMEATFKNANSNYLSAGDSPLPSVYLLMSFVFLGVSIYWTQFLRTNKIHIHQVHHMMTLLVCFKTFSLFAEAMRYAYMKKHGDLLTNWNEVYYIFMFLKGTMLFVVILLIGTGWSILKTHLSERDKMIISVVLVLQVLSNTAMVVVEETAIGTRRWVAWRDILHVVDIVCCFAILFPIIWSMRNLRQSATTDGKAHLNLIKLTQFRSFYLLVVAYVYFTRIALYLLSASLPYHATWVSVLVNECATVIFFSLTGYKFRPLNENPYLQVSTHIEALDEFGLSEEDELEIQSFPVTRRDSPRRGIGSPRQFRVAV